MIYLDHNAPNPSSTHAHGRRTALLRPVTRAQRPPASPVAEHPERQLPGRDGERLLAAIPGIAAATGSACHSGRTEPSPVLTAMGLDPARARRGPDTTEAEIDQAAAWLADAAAADRVKIPA
jgi:cysteine desulfurase